MSFGTVSIYGEELFVKNVLPAFLSHSFSCMQEFFISGGDGLPRGKVENLAVRAQLVIKLHGLEVSFFYTTCKMPSINCRLEVYTITAIMSFFFLKHVISVFKRGGGSTLPKRKIKIT